MNTARQLELAVFNSTRKLADEIYLMAEQADQAIIDQAIEKIQQANAILATIRGEMHYQLMKKGR